MQHTLLDDVKSHFDHWRATRNKRCRIPESLWDKVKSLVEHYPLSVTLRQPRVTFPSNNH
jgi:hypothetical protein